MRMRVKKQRNLFCLGQTLTLKYLLSEIISAKMYHKFNIAITIMIGVLIVIIKSEFTTEDCWALGFNKANLLCPSCDQLPKFGLEILKDHCKECCHNDETVQSNKQYAKAVLEVCTCKFGAYPQIQAFIKSDKPAQFSNLQIKYVRGLDPIIKLYNKDGHLKETVAIEKWNTDSVVEFLNAYLEKEPDYLKSNMI